MRLKRVLLCCCCILLSGCTNTSTTTKKTKDYTYILFATPLEDHPIWLRAKKGFMDACAIEGYKCDWTGPMTIDTTAMNEVIHTGLLQKADAIITQGVVDPALLEKAYKQKIPVILVDSDMKTSNRAAYFGKDFKEQAQLLLKDIELNYGKQKKLKVAIQVAEKSFEIAQDQIKEVEKVFATHKGGFEIVAVSESKSDQVRAKKEWSKVFSTYGDINVAISFAGESAESCYETAAALGINKSTLIYGVDDVESTLKLLKEDKIDGTITAPFYDYGFETVEYLKSYFNEDNKKVNQIYPINIELITPEKVEAYERTIR